MVEAIKFSYTEAGFLIPGALREEFGSARNWSWGAEAQDAQWILLEDCLVQQSLFLKISA